MGMKTLAIALMSICAAHAADCTVRSGPNVNALVQLYTSEGCSSCPPAEQWLSKFSRSPRAGVIPIAFHVHYWDYIGWKDIYATPANTERQKAFAEATHASSVYTPQVVLAGNDFRAWSVERAFDEAVRAVNARKATAAIELTPARQADGSIEGRASAVVSEAPKHLTLVVALTQDGITSKPNAGENKGETLAQNFVVRDVAEFRGTGTIAGSFRFTPKANWQPERTRVVAFVHDPRSGRVLQALAAPVCR